MNDSDIEGLAFTEKKANEVRQGIVDYSKQILELVGVILTKETSDLGNSVQHAIDVIRPADRKFTLQQVIAMRKVLEESRAEMVVVTNDIDQRLRTMATYIEIYIANGVPPDELDLGGGDIARWFIPLRAVYDRLINRMAPIHPLAYGVLDGVNLDISRRILNACQTNKGVQDSLRHAQICLKDIQEQPTFLMSADGLDEREAIIKKLVTFFQFLAVFMEKP